MREPRQSVRAPKSRIPHGHQRPRPVQDRCRPVELAHRLPDAGGGGFVVDEAQAQAGRAGATEVALPYEFDSAAELLAICRRHGMRISQVMLANERAWRSEGETRTALHGVWDAMRGCVTRGLAQEGLLPGGLRVRRRAAAMHRALRGHSQSPSLISDTFAALDWVNLYALAVNEENAGGGPPAAPSQPGRSRTRRARPRPRATRGAHPALRTAWLVQRAHRSHRPRLRAAAATSG